jgi:hypothetical protein
MAFNTRFDAYSSGYFRRDRWGNFLRLLPSVAGVEVDSEADLAGCSPPDLERFAIA